MDWKNLENWKDMPIPAPQDDEFEEVAWGIEKAGEAFKKLTINRPKTGPHDVKVDLEFCGICHTDVHVALNELGGSMYPMVPGHELVGTVVEVGANVTKVKVGDRVGYGCIADGCMDCNACKRSEE